MEKNNDTSGKSHLNGLGMHKSSLKSIKQLDELGASLPPIKQIFGNYILEDSLSLFPSQQGIGKTWLMVGTCVAISEGWEVFLGEKISAGNTLFINCELSEELMAKRVHNLLKRPPKPINFAKNICKIYTTRKSIEEEIQAIQLICDDLKPVLVVIDNFRTGFQNIDSNNNRDVSKAMVMLLNLRDEIGCAMVLTDHTRKHSSHLLTNSDLQAGSGVKSDLADSDMFLRRSSQDSDYRLLKRIKSRNAPEAVGAKLLKLNPDTFWFELIDDDVNEADHIGGEAIPKEKGEKIESAKILRDAGKTFEEIAETLNVPKSTIHRWLK